MLDIKDGEDIGWRKTVYYPTIESEECDHCFTATVVATNGIPLKQPVSLDAQLGVAVAWL